MKQNFKIHLIICLIGFFFFGSVYSQSTDSVYFIVDTKPDFKYKSYEHLNEKINEYFREHSKLKILKVGEKTGAYQGIIVITFIVEKNGTLTNIGFDFKGFKSSENEFKTLLINTGGWTPGLIEGKPVRTSLSFLLHVNLE